MDDRRFLSIAPLPILALLGGCISYTPHSIIAETMPIRTFDGVEAIGPAHGESCSRWLLNIPVAPRQRLGTALEAAKQSSGADALVGVSADGVYRSFFVYADECIHVRGTAVRIAKEEG